MPAAPPIPRTFHSVQYIRGLCAVAIVLWHGLSQLQRFQPHLSYPTWGAISVDLFFVISGFVMWHMMAAQPVSFGEFWRKRFVRAIPFYWLMTSVVVIVMLVAPSLLSSSRFDSTHVLTSYLFVPWLHPVLHGQFAPVLIPGWTLNYEIAFYAILSASLFLPVRWRAPSVISAIVLAAVAPMLLNTASSFFIFYTQPIILEFASGVLIGWMIWNDYRLSARLSFALMVLGFAAVVVLPSPHNVVPAMGFYHSMFSRVLEYFVPSFAIIAGAVFFDAARAGVRKWKLLALIGDASYSIYMIHTMTLPVLTKAWSAAGLASDWRWNALYVVLGIVLSTVAGIVCYRTVEMPLFRSLDRLTQPRRNVPAQSPAEPKVKRLPLGLRLRPQS